MVITEPNKFVAEVHDRMPVLLRPGQCDTWLDGAAGKEVLMPAVEDVALWVALYIGLLVLIGAVKAYLK